jgi:hypothetical protein
MVTISDDEKRKPLEGKLYKEQYSFNQLDVESCNIDVIMQTTATYSMCFKRSSYAYY